MQLDDITVSIRPRGRLESIDLGFALARANWRSVARAWMVTVLPIMLALNVMGYWYPAWALALLWWLKPLYDRITLWVLSRAVFGAEATSKDLRAALPALLLRTQLLQDLTWRRFNVQRSFNLPVAQLEDQRGRARRERLRVLHKDALYAAQGLTVAGSTFEGALYWALFGLLAMMLPPAMDLDLIALFFGEVTPQWFSLLNNVFYALAICLVEPFYVAAGFTLYLNRRTWLEGWDLELAFRRMAQAVAAADARLATMDKVARVA